ncbi:RtcB family protein [Asaia krungthepensis]|uniref:3'-phosphate/5'-hydroxy nucleic acid ligase n=1 Tax=Asaia krungthepensis NRIC 0535 TaxID=1307925 RepID=A0ABQ0Q2A9_9PROT|nr:RtcB family protein [Asaia krungthepensis]GBQ87988.1 hypothetical protein AA0535_1422 [Asaia krungthepensis NRIC 0535]
MNMTAPMEIDGKVLIGWGHMPGPGFGAMLDRARALAAQGDDEAAIRAAVPPPPLPEELSLQEAATVPLHISLDAETQDEAENRERVIDTMRTLVRTPTVVAAAIMPDACPAGPLGTIPVGGIVSTRNAIHPGMHSPDICCSVMMTDLGPVDPGAVLDAASGITHFGAGGRDQGRRFTLSLDLLDAFRANPFLGHQKMLHTAQAHMGTQGDGNHFLFVGRSRATGHTALVTHHGSRGPGAQLYRAGVEVAERWRRHLSPETLRQNAWIPTDSDEGRDYWQALQIIRRWTKANHNAIHQAVTETLRLTPVERFWNEHNFVFERDGLYHHGKGATPAWGSYADDATGKVLIPLNMAEPVLVARGRDAAHALGFAPHGAGRNMSRTEHRRRMGDATPEALLAAETPGLDIRFSGGRIDVSELPSSYKRASSVVEQIGRYGLADIEDYIDPVGCIMAGDMPPPWMSGHRSGRRS